MRVRLALLAGLAACCVLEAAPPEFGELIEFLIQVGLDELEFSFIVAEQFRSCVGVHCVDCGCSSVDQVRFILVDKKERLVRAVMVDWLGGVSNRVTSCD